MPNRWLTSRRAVLLGITLWIHLTASGGLEIYDADVRLRTAVSWVEGRGGDLGPQAAWSGTAVGRGGAVYAFYGPLQSVAMVPGVLIARVASSDPQRQREVAAFFFSTVALPAIAWMVLWALGKALDAFGFTDAEGNWALVGAGLGCIFFHYARLAQEESLAALGYALWLWGAAELASRRDRGLVLAVLGASVALATRWSSGPTLAVLAVGTAVLLVRGRALPRPGTLAAAVGIGAGTLLALGAFNAARFGSPLETGYGLFFRHSGEPLFSAASAPEHFAALLVSPYKGLLWYSPLLALALVPPSRLRVVGWTALAAVAVTCAFVATYTYWGGGLAWGPRLVVAPTVLLTPALASALRWRPARALVPAAVMLQLLSVTLPDAQAEFLHDRVPGCGTWSVGCAPWTTRLTSGMRAFSEAALPPAAGLPASSSAAVSTGPEALLETSDLRALAWWPIRGALRAHRWPLALGWAVMLVLAAVATSLVVSALGDRRKDVVGPATTW